MLKRRNDLPKAKPPHVWADSLRPTAYGMNRGCWRSCREPLAVRRKPMALPDALVYELYGLTKDEIRIVEGG